MNRQPVRVLLFCAASWLLVGCAGLVNALTPSEGYGVEADLSYGPDPRQRFDLYVPEGAPADAPVIVFFYGGGWESGSKDLYAFVGQAFASRGYIVAVPDYRLYPQVRYSGILEDGAAAVRAVVGSTGPRPLFLVGHSAGAYIAAMLALDERRLSADGSCRPITGAVGLAGPYDFLPLESDRLREIFGPGPAQPDTQPIAHVDRNDPPMLLVTGDADDTVRPANTLRLAARLREAGGRAATRIYPGLGHVRIVAALAAPLRFTAPVLDDIDVFLSGISLPSGVTCVGLQTAMHHHAM